MGLLLDTSVLIAVERGELDSVPEGEALGIAAITAAELLHGLHRSSQAAMARRLIFVEGTLARTPTYPFTLEIARVHARLWAELAKAGRAVNAHDLQIAATALWLGWRVATLDVSDFARIPGLSLWSPG